MALFLAKFVMLLLAVRMALAPFGHEALRVGEPLGEGLVFGRCAWPRPLARQVTARLARLVSKDAAETPGLADAHPDAVSALLVLPLGPTALQNYDRHALGRLRC